MVCKNRGQLLGNSGVKNVKFQFQNRNQNYSYETRKKPHRTKKKPPIGLISGFLCLVEATRIELVTKV